MQVHAYLQAPGGRTAYLSELGAGAEVVVPDAGGQQRVATVGRVKIETRPLVRLVAHEFAETAARILDNLPTLHCALGSDNVSPPIITKPHVQIRTSGHVSSVLCAAHEHRTLNSPRQRRFWFSDVA